MASKKKEKEVFYKAVANQFIKYNGAFIKAGQEFSVKEEDKEELSAYSEIEKNPVKDFSNTGEGSMSEGDSDKEENNAGEGAE